MEQALLHDLESRCTQEEAPACRSMCPLHVDGRDFARFMGEGRFDEARAVLERFMPLAGLCAFLCQGECMPHCRRAETDTGVNLPMLERACALHSRPGKAMPLPASGKSATLAGSGLSSLCLAFELGKKGCKVKIVHTGEAGQALAARASDLLPRGALSGAMERLLALRVSFERVDDFSPDLCATLLRENKILYLGLDDPALDFRLSAFGLEHPGDPLTLETAIPGIFAGGAGISFIKAAAAGRRAAGSITRFMQGVSPSSARAGEEVYPTKLFTDLSRVLPVPPVEAADPKTPTLAEAAAEAARCIQCSCLACVEKCAWMARYGAYPKRYAREIYNTLAMKVGHRRANAQINSCTLCGLCAAVCPNGADMGRFCAEARKEMVSSRHMPASAHEFALEDMVYSNSPEVAFYRHQPGHERCRYALFPGCRLPASLPEQTGKLYAFLARNLEGGVGFFFRCCSMPAKWSGRPLLTASCAAGLRETWEEAGRPELILACPACALFFSAELAEIPIKSLWETLAALPLPDTARALDGVLALHDPCTARDRPDLAEAARSLALRLGQKTEDLPLSRGFTRCCGYGGLSLFANPEVGAEISRSRLGDTDKDLLCWCVMCRESLRSAGMRALHFLDLLFPGEKDPAVRPAPGISTRQENALAFRRAMLQNFWNEEDEVAGMEPAIFSMDGEVAEKLEARRILRSDVEKVLLHSKEKGAQFRNPQSGRILSCLRPKQVTFWVEYSENADGSFTVHNAYCHRMRVPGTPGEGLPTAVILEGFDPQGGRV
ncbi:MAG: 4Fe-4S dicluster domain-containing protein [Desulfovibrio sp.]|jgi:Fe-S oxidoreductase|nr:4Fe-4S dicluster domain-containing protein [Desulfovibrio sp.]